ncbi:MAG TPA: hypothetical protein VJ385_21425 [Fibrobacteria bacterium]|nr:hypothetical protein [Fibrobacteria bacterium]
MNSKRMKIGLALIPVIIQACLENPERKNVDENELKTSAITTGVDLKMNNYARPGLANDIGAGTSGTWVVGTPPNGNGFRMYRWNGSNDWNDWGGGGMKISVAKNTPWAANSIYNLYYMNGSTWVSVPGTSSVIDVAANDSGTIGVIEAAPIRANGGMVLKKVGNTWVRMGTMYNALSIAVDAAGTFWVSDIANQIWRLASWDSDWQYMYTGAVDIGAASDDVIYVCSNSQTPDSNYRIFRISGSVWRQVKDISGNALSGVHIDAVDDNHIWYTKANKKIYEASL